MLVTRASAVLILAALVAAFSCDGRLAHIFGGYAYDAGNDCILPAGTIDVIDGPAPAVPCSTVTCWVAPDGSVYVTTTACDAPPDYRNGTNDTSGPCVKALAAYGMENGAGRCPASPDGGADGGS
jgi:hypothetical protein